MLENLVLNIASIHQAYASGTPVQALLDECLRRIEVVDDPGIFISLCEEKQLLAQVETLPPMDLEAQPLWGVPFVVKDNIDIAGMATTAGCPDYRYIAEQDAFVIQLLKAAGAIILGKTNMDQFATGLVGVRTPYPTPRNALDSDIVPGGSSSGSAVAVAQGLCCFSLGTDTAGSGRIPAALNRIVGLKPSIGRLSNTGVVPACRSLDTVSVFALTVADAYLVQQVLNVFDPQDEFSRPLPALSPLNEQLVASGRCLCIGVPAKQTRRFYGDVIQEAAFNRYLNDLETAGFEPRELDFTPFYQVAALLYEGSWVAERHAAIGDFVAFKPEAIVSATRTIIERAEAFSATDLFKDQYRLRKLKRQTDELMKSIDCLCVPSIPRFVTVKEVEADPYTANSQLGTYTNFVNLLDLCALTIPASDRSDGRPGSVTLIAKSAQDQQLANLAWYLQKKWNARPGNSSASVQRLTSPFAEMSPAPTHEELAIAVVGAHLSGLPLNGELTDRGGRYLYASKTAARYRLYRLPGGPPLRPGLVRAGAGSSIAVEVWALPKKYVGDFIAGIPSPLGIGTLILEDGTEVKGFICEDFAIDEAEDITHFGGWRSYIADSDATQSKH